MTSPLSQEQRAELVAKAKAATPGPWFHCQPSMVVPKQRTIHGPVPARRVDYVSTWADMGTPPGHRVVLPMPGEEGPSVRSLDMAFIAAANPSTILAYEATVQALTERLENERAAGWRDAVSCVQYCVANWHQDHARRTGEGEALIAAGDELVDALVNGEPSDWLGTEWKSAQKWMAELNALTVERDASLERVKEADEFAAFVARHSGPARRAGLSDKEFRSIVEHHPAVQDLLTKSTEQEDG